MTSRDRPDSAAPASDTAMPHTPTRAETIGEIRRLKGCDVVVIGGGIHGAVTARLAAFNKLKTVLFERGDYAEATSSRSSKMAHGGLRYLELLDFAQVREGVRAREDLFSVAPHLVKPHPFLIPVARGARFSRLKLAAGLTFYDLFSPSGRRHRWFSSEALGDTGLAGFATPLAGAFQYYDGIMSDSRLVVENIIAARQEGALVLNHAPVVLVTRKSSGRVLVKWRDGLTGTHYELETGIVINCAGPWVAEAGRVKPSELRERIVFSRGTHLLFNRPWRGPALILPTGEPSRYYFVWPHPAGTMVGTTERLVTRAERDPLPSPDEINELLALLARDLPSSGLDRSTLHYCFAGIRTLPLRSASDGKETARLSRRHVWQYSNGMLSLLGGKLTTAAWTAEEGVKLALRLAEVPEKLVGLSGRPFPGAGLYEESVGAFRSRATAAGVPTHLIERAISRLGSRVRYLEGEGLQPIADRLLRGEISLAVIDEQAETLEDLMRRRLELELEADLGEGVVEQVAEELARLKRRDVGPELTAYRERTKRIRALVSGDPLPEDLPEAAAQIDDRQNAADGSDRDTTEAS